MIEKWKTLNSQFVFNNKWVTIRQDEIELPNGKVIDDFFIIVRPDIALVFPVTPNREVVFVRQYRHATNEIMLELPAGGFDPETESAETAARRELQEETGYVADRMIKLATLYDNPIKDTNKIHLFLTENVTYSGKRNLDITEDIEVELVPISEVMEKVYRGEINVTGTTTALFMGLHFLGHLRAEG
ncbi:NUDIX hydrolase [Planktothrix sp. FACHB-1355]|uniref:NUDIX hydrolase n=1 Tax=Aerosakkonema funiforme FACHB-1375 TaxID=2949571 RepID=A0A926V9W0_9CYAN|nr:MULTISPECIES: NUDIX hydrolase [Oscillatoriales]MBD2179876.1 NUDIX hydrolase [Aerosakkonema funiforme FACHB-1375]MBD3558667.1 NUDIX hydrolase [Planktothrix sp. FACHB-1355]